jgi:hypothetical protein
VTTSEIISDLYISRELDDCISKMVRAGDRGDFKQELFLIVATIEEGIIKRLHDDNKLKFYVVKIIMNLANQERNTYHKKYRSTKVVYDTDKVMSLPHPAESSEMEMRQAREDKEMVLVHEVSNLESKFKTHYYTRLCELIAEHGSMRAVSRLTGIPTMSISDAIKKVRNHLKTI